MSWPAVEYGTRVNLRWRVSWSAVESGHNVSIFGKMFSDRQLNLDFMSQSRDYDGLLCQSGTYGWISDLRLDVVSFKQKVLGWFQQLFLEILKDAYPQKQSTREKVPSAYDFQKRITYICLLGNAKYFCICIALLSSLKLYYYV